MQLEAVIVGPLASYRKVLPELRHLFETEWPSWYGVGGRGSAAADLESYAALGGLPFGVVALDGETLCGVAALKKESIPSHQHLSPWAAALLVKPALRGRGIGSLLLAALEQHARRQGYRAIHCATASAESLLQRRGYLLSERVLLEGKDLGVYQLGL